MVSREKAKYYKGRLATIRQQLAEQIEKQFPAKETSYKALIAAGAGRLRPEEQLLAQLESLEARIEPVPAQVA